MDITKVTLEDITPEIKSWVSTCLLARAFAETMRAQVDEIETEILETAEYFAAPEWSEKYGIKKQRILAPKDAYLMDEAEYKDYREECVAGLKKAGLDKYLEKGQTLEDGYCPALVAESLLVDAKHGLIKAAQAVFPEITANKLLCHHPGVETMNKYVDLWIGLVVSLPDFKNPLTGEKKAA